MLNYFKKNIKELLKLNPYVKKLLVSTLIFTAIFEIVKIAPPYIFKVIIDTLISNDIIYTNSFSFIVILVLGYFVSLSIMALIENIGASKMIQLTHRTQEEIDVSLFGKLLKLNLSYHDDNNTGSNIGKIVRGSIKMIELFFNIGENIMPIICQSFITLIIFFYIDWRIGLSYILFLPIFTVALAKGSKATQTLREKYHELFYNFTDAITQSIGNIRTVKDFANEEKELKNATYLLSEYRKCVDKRTIIGMRYRLFKDALINIARGLTLVIAIWLMFRKEMSPGELVFVMTLAEKAYLNLLRLNRAYFQIQDAEPAINQANKILESKEMIIDNSSSKKFITKGSIKFENVSFIYNKNTKDHALKNISFEIKPKEVIALVGRSGSGKSTIIKLLLRHFESTNGNILIDNTNIKDFSFINLRKDIAIVSQEVELWNDTIANNIAYGSQNPSIEDIKKASKMAYADNFIENFEKGYDTLIGERGIRLSGGQKQRLAIARAIYKNPKILIFDEATSSLDSESEKFIHKSINELSGKLTLIIIAHRFATIEHADKIILLDNGELKEYGTHKELMKKKGIFANLRKLQELV